MEFYKPKDYQIVAGNHLLDNPHGGLFMQMGLGKTVVTLTAIHKLIFDRLEINTALVVGTKRIASMVWSDEIDKWEHLQDLKVSKIIGNVSERKKAIKEKAHIYTISCDNIAWLISYLHGSFPFDALVIDESSKFKNHASKRFEALKLIWPLAKRRIILTGTPVPNGLMDIWSQVYILDGGERLGRKITHYRKAYFEITDIVGSGHRLYGLKKGDTLLGENVYEKEIYSKIEDIVISMSKSDYLEMPPIQYKNVKIAFDPDIAGQYRDFEKEKVLELPEGDITAVNAVSLSGKLLQFCSGAVYDENKIWHEIHNAKLEALEEIIEESLGHSVLIAYWFKHDKERILKRFGKHCRWLNSDKDFRDWNNKKIKAGLLHPNSGGHGLNLQSGGHIITWYSLPNWNLELYDQFNARLDRPGQEFVVTVNNLACKSTIEIDMIRALQRKADGQKACMKALDARRIRYMKEIS